MKYTAQDIAQLERRKRGHLVNALSGVKSANLVGTVNKKGQTNLAIVSSVVHLGSDPALLGFIQRPTSVEKHTYENIIATEKYTFNAVEQSFVEKAHQTSARYSRADSEFDAVGLTAEFSPDFLAPFVKESNIKIGLSLEEIISIRSNNTKLMVGRVEVIYFPENCFKEDGHLAIYENNVVGISGLDTYLNISNNTRLSYAKPDLPLKKL